MNIHYMLFGFNADKGAVIGGGKKRPKSKRGSSHKEWPTI